MNNDNQHNLNNNSNNDKTEKRFQDLSQRGLNTATGGAWNKVHNAPLIGQAAKRGEQKIANKLENSKLVQKAANPLNHQRPNLGVPTNNNFNDGSGENTLNKNKSFNQSNTNNSIRSKKNDIGSLNLKKSLAHKAYNILKNNNRVKKGETSSDNDDNFNSNQESSSNSIKEELGLIKRRIKIIKLTLIGLALFAFIFFVLLIAEVVSGGNALRSTPLISTNTYGTDKFEAITEDESDYHNIEIDYYKELQKVKKNYDETVNATYVNAILMQLYYENDFEDKDNKLVEMGGFDFPKMTKLVDTFAKIISEINSTDYEIDGEIFKSLLNNNIIKDYYKDVVKTTTLKEILQRAFEMAEAVEADEIVDDTVVTKETNVSVKEITKENGKTITKSKTISMNDYIADSIYARTSILSSESVKAYTIAYSTNIVSQNKNLSIDSNTASATNDLCSVSLGCSYDSNGNLVSGAGTQSNKNANFYNGGYYYKVPLNSSEIATLNSNINSVYGNVLVNSDGTYKTLDISKIEGLGEGDYKSILNSGYGNLTIKNIGENSYILDGSYGSKKVLTNAIFYDQNDYPNTSFCGLKKETIETSGCGVTSMAIVASTYENNRKYDPIYMNKEATNKKMCGAGSGTSQAFFCKEARALNYKCSSGSKYNKSLLNSVLKHLSEGHLVIARMGPSHFTGGGHYIVLGGVDPDTKKVYVYDPNNKDNSNPKWRNTGNGWYSFNDIIVKEAYNFYIIWKG